jgi:hypothetical protein
VGKHFLLGLYKDSKLGIFVTKVGFEKLWPLLKVARKVNM